MFPIAKALNMRPGVVLSVVGAGGKTSFIYHLCGEIFAYGHSVIFSTTTRIQPPVNLSLFLDKDPERIKTFLHEQSKPFCLALGLELNQEGKVVGLPLEWIVELPKSEPSAVILVEADGSKGLPLKAPAGHEPVIPPNSSMVVVVAGVDSVGISLTEEKVHRAGLIGKILGKELGTILEIEDVARIMSHPRGGLKDIPPAARVVFLLNKADNEAECVKARAIARVLRQIQPEGRIIIASLRYKKFHFDF